MIFGPRPAPYLPSRCESPFSVFVVFRVPPLNSELMSHEWQSACTSKFEPEGISSVTEARTLLMVTSSLGGLEKRTSTEPLVLSSTILPVTFSRDTEAFLVRD